MKITFLFKNKEKIMDKKKYNNKIKNKIIYWTIYKKK